MSHGIKRARESQEKEAARKEKERAQVQEYRALTDDVMNKRKLNDLSKDAFELTTQLLKKNPEFFTVWNYRKRILSEGLFKENESEIPKLLTQELHFLFLRLREYPKCYWIWLYRQWCLEVHPDADWDTELKLVTRMLEADSRNFHGWEYRRYVVASIEKRRGISLAKSEFDYTTTKTNDISNFSAWHNRALLVPRLLPPSDSPAFETERKSFLKRELDRTHNGLWVDPDDQSAWLYHSWLLGETFSLEHGEERKAVLAPTSVEEKVEVLEREIGLLKELLNEAPDAKWCLTSLSIYGTALSRLRKEKVPTEIVEMVEKLEKNDPMRAGRYKDWRTAIEA